MSDDRIAVSHMPCPRPTAPARPQAPPLSGRWGLRPGQARLSAKQGSDRAPWRQGQMNLPPAGLREAVLRTQYLIDIGQVEALGHQSRCAIENAVRRWAVGDGCTPAEWAELVKLVGGAALGAPRSA